MPPQKYLANPTTSQFGIPTIVVCYVVARLHKEFFLRPHCARGGGGRDPDHLLCEDLRKTFPISFVVYNCVRCYPGPMGLLMIWAKRKFFLEVRFWVTYL